uniref:Large ribosomal subunit protein uL4c n=1 Tax=Polysiphonia sertularioides TaxID=945028 RepID=A0A1Z1M964_9FLOR|nr:ribosomal protein L4 [Polysiphonia sertularioides]ARW62526.1 ribosomal protein L4 [Polysiphonia sertularioides]
MSKVKILNYKIKDRNTENSSIQLRISENEEGQMYIIHKALKQQLNNKRTRNANSKTRSEVQGGGRKPWKQKGTGRARAGSSRSPLWRGGGVIFGPRTQTYRSKINKKERRLAINTLLYNKFKKTIVVEELLQHITKPNTKKAVQEIEKFGINVKKNEKILIAIKESKQNIYLSLRNIKNIEIIEVKSINILSLLQADTLLITNEALQNLSSTI